MTPEPDINKLMTQMVVSTNAAQQFAEGGKKRKNLMGDVSPGLSPEEQGALMSLPSKQSLRKYGEEFEIIIQDNND